MPEPKIRIYDIGNKRANVEDFPCVVHLACDEREQVRGLGPRGRPPPLRPPIPPRARSVAFAPAHASASLCSAF